MSEMLTMYQGLMGTGVIEPAIMVGLAEKYIYT
jgi:hypothetical protein